MYAHSFIAMMNDDNDKEELTMKDIDVYLHYEDIEFNFSGLNGGGLVTSTLNTAIDIMGKSIVNSQKKAVTAKIAEIYHTIISDLF